MTNPMSTSSRTRFPKDRVSTVGYKNGVVRMPQNCQVMETKETEDLSQIRELNAMWNPGPEKGQPWKNWGNPNKVCSLVHSSVPALVS